MGYGYVWPWALQNPFNMPYDYSEDLHFIILFIYLFIYLFFSSQYRNFALKLQISRNFQLQSFKY